MVVLRRIGCSFRGGGVPHREQGARAGSTWSRTGASRVVGIVPTERHVPGSGNHAVRLGLSGSGGRGVTRAGGAGGGPGPVAGGWGVRGSGGRGVTQAGESAERGEAVVGPRPVRAQRLH